MRKRILAIIFLLGVSTGVYLNSLDGKFVFDDKGFVENNEYLRSKAGLIKYFTSDVAIFSQMSGYYRPIVGLSFWIDYKLWKLNPKGYHLTNVILHAGSTLILFFLTLLIFNELRLAFVSSLLFALHPVHTEAVSFISGRTDPIAFIFYMLSILLYVRDKRFFSSIFFFLGLLSKEMAGSLPFILFAYEVLMRNNHKVKEILRRQFPHLIVFILYIVIRILALNLFIKLGFSYERLLSFGKIFILYLKVLLYPYSLNAYYHISLVFEPITIFGFLVILIFVLITIFKKKFKRLSFVLSFFLLSLIPVSNIFPLGGILMAERFLYLPSAGFIWILAIGFEKIISKYKNFALVGLFLYSGFYAFVTVSRNFIWKDAFSLYSDMVRKSPFAAAAHCGMGVALEERGDISGALREYEISKNLDPNSVLPHYNLGIVYRKLGEMARSEEELIKAIEIDSMYGQAHFELGNTYDRQGRTFEAIEEYKKSLRIIPGFSKAHNNLGVIYEREGIIDKAREEYRMAISLNPTYVLAHVNLGNLEAGAGKLELAMKSYYTAISIDEKNTEAHYNLAVVLEAVGNKREALIHYRIFLSLNPKGMEDAVNNAQERVRELLGL